VTEATAAWERLSEELPGRPNCVFNVPLGLEGTKAAEILLDMGIGIYAHVYSTDQLEVFGDLTERYKNTQSFITLMTSWVDRFVDIELCPGKPSDIKVHCWPSVLLARRAFKDYWLGCNENFRYSETAFNLAAITDPAVLERNLFNEKAPIHISLTPKTREYYETEWDRVHKDFSNPSEEIEEALEKSKCFQELMGE
jgi:hypothetical protein